MDQHQREYVVSKAEFRQLEERLGAASDRLTRIEAQLEHFLLAQTTFHTSLRAELKHSITDHEKSELKDFEALRISLVEVHQILTQSIEALTSLRKTVADQNVELMTLKSERTRVYGWIAGATCVVSIAWMIVKDFFHR